MSEDYVVATSTLHPPIYVGGYDIGGVRFMLTRRPSWWHRLMVRLVLGWEWHDE